MDLEFIGLSTNRLFVLLFLGLGPIRIIMAWMNIAIDLTAKEQRRVAWRITWVGMVMVIGIMFLGFFTVKNIAPQKEWVAIGASFVLIVSTLAHRSPEPQVSDEPPFQKAMRMAVYPLAVPTMINPAGLGILIIVSAYVSEPAPYLTFFGVVAFIFLINFGLMLLVGHYHRGMSTAVMALVGQVFAILLVSLGVYVIFTAMSRLGIITLAVE